ncbi:MULTISPECIES: helix-turn-helix transcriptional regulator [unclassified Streptomyces]|uniref:helix-turn-helix domain-containing protein n=1 Tax=unclassified Streptomyces TaxID=2593676 RepID=UPI000CD57520|nr:MULTISPECIES: helix-turn-helix transcriptional regulator [unclassified Streptomyces]
MRPDSSPDPEPIAFGQRLKILRTRRGMSRPVLAGLLGRSPSWLKQVESGALQVPKLSILLRIAEALRVRELSELTGDDGRSGSLFAGPGHPRLPDVRAALDAFPTVGDRPAPSAVHLQARLARAWSARHSSPNHREVVGALLPDLIADAQCAARQADTPAAREAAQSVLAHVYFLTQFFAAYQPDAPLLWRVAERGMVAAHDSGDPHTVAIAAWLLAEAHRDRGTDHLDAAAAVAEGALRHLEAHLPDADHAVLAMTGALHAAAGFTAARRCDAGTAWRHWDLADTISARLPRGYFHPVTSFSRSVMGAHAVTIAVELRAGGESVRQAARVDASAIPSRPRRARHRVEEARGHHLAGSADVALATLEHAYLAAPETVRYNGYARAILLEEAESRNVALRERAASLAVKVGVLSA